MVMSKKQFSLSNQKQHKEKKNKNDIIDNPIK
jgi:hypothetical protein